MMRQGELSETINFELEAAWAAWARSRQLRAVCVEALREVMPEERVEAALGRLGAADPRAAAAPAR